MAHKRGAEVGLSSVPQIRLVAVSWWGFSSTVNDICGDVTGKYMFCSALDDWIIDCKVLAGTCSDDQWAVASLRIKHPTFFSWCQLNVTPVVGFFVAVVCVLWRLIQATRWRPVCLSCVRINCIMIWVEHSQVSFHCLHWYVPLVSPTVS